MEQFYSLFINTLNMLLLPNKLEGHSYLSIIQEKLTELEGDYYTFLYKIDIEKLAEGKYIPFKFVNDIELIRNQIDNIEKELWNPYDFIYNVKWNSIRNIVISMFKEDVFI